MNYSLKKARIRVIGPVTRYAVFGLLVLSISACVNLRTMKQSDTDNVNSIADTTITATTSDVMNAETTNTVVKKLNENDVLKQGADQGLEEGVDILLARSLFTKPNLHQQHNRTNTQVQSELLIQALTAYSNENWQTGLAFIEQASALGTLNSVAYVLKSDLTLALGNIELATTALQSALASNKYDVKALNRLASLMREQGDFTRALSLLNRAIEAVPSDAASYRNRGVLYDLYLDQKPEALLDYKHYFALLKLQVLEREGPLVGAVDEQKANIAKAGISVAQIKKDIKLVKRWLVDLPRQIKASERKHQAQIGAKQ